LLWTISLSDGHASASLRPAPATTTPGSPHPGPRA